ncbi:MAG TPA: twin-arginine translocase subunit TatC [Gemmatales bacterium]|nr:twin-arginine translocase subunit TatC [Gemmatales bacterium]
MFLPLFLFGKRPATPVYDDDFFADTRMSFGEHIEDLRSHLVRALKWFCLGLILGFVFAKPMVNYITKPVEDAVKAYYEERRQTVGKGSEEITHPLNKPIPLKFDVQPQELSALVRKVLPEARRCAPGRNHPDTEEPGEAGL